jgi:predicted NUDIX family NTP pyrophosphohydrolase
LPAISAGLLAHRRVRNVDEVLLVHPGGPFWKHRDLGAWSVPKGLVRPGEGPLDAAIREFSEEVGPPPPGPYAPLAPCRQAGGKLVLAFLVEADLDVTGLSSNLVSLEWPRGSGRMQSFPEIDRAAYFAWPEALAKILASQRPILLEAQARLHGADHR